MKICPSSLPGFTNHYIPRGIAEINQLMDKILADKHQQSYFWFKVNTLPNFRQLIRDVEQLTTADGYGYQIGLLFDDGQRRIIILLPHRHDSQLSDGVSFDRSIACYVAGESVAPHAQKLFQELLILLKKVTK